MRLSSLLSTSFDISQEGSPENRGAFFYGEVCYNRAMKKKILLCLVSLMIGVASLTPAPVMAMCGTGHAFFGLKSWYHYLDCNADGTIAESTFAGDNLVEAVWKIVAVVISDLFSCYLWSILLHFAFRVFTFLPLCCALGESQSDSPAGSS